MRQKAIVACLSTLVNFLTYSNSYVLFRICNWSTGSTMTWKGTSQKRKKRKGDIERKFPGGRCVSKHTHLKSQISFDPFVPKAKLHGWQRALQASVSCCDKPSPTYLLAKSQFTLWLWDIHLSWVTLLMFYGSTFHYAISVHHIRQITAHKPLYPSSSFTHTHLHSAGSIWVDLVLSPYVLTSLYSYLGVFRWFLFTFPSRLFTPRCGSLDGCAALSLCCSQHQVSYVNTSAYQVSQVSTLIRAPSISSSQLSSEHNDQLSMHQASQVSTSVHQVYLKWVHPCGTISKVSASVRHQVSKVKVSITFTVLLVYKLASPRTHKKIGQHLSRDYWPPGHENPAMGFFWGVDHH